MVVSVCPAHCSTAWRAMKPFSSAPLVNRGRPISAVRYLCWRGKGFEPTIWHDSPPGWTARQRCRTGRYVYREGGYRNAQTEDSREQGTRDCFAEPVIGPAQRPDPLARNDD